METIIVSPPLRGQWQAITTPGDKVPSHGTHAWGMAYAYDFIRLGQNGLGSVSWQKKSFKKYLLGLVKVSDTFSWGEAIYSPIDGIVRETVNNVPERHRLHAITDIGNTLLNGLFFSYGKGKIEKLAGNYLIIEGKDCCAFIAHAKTNSIKPKVGDAVSAGEIIAQVGHSGNSSIPHLHFQLMDRADIRLAKGLPCGFNTYDIKVNEHWETVNRGTPNSQHTLRF